MTLGTKLRSINESLRAGRSSCRISSGTQLWIWMLSTSLQKYRTRVEYRRSKSPGKFIIRGTLRKISWLNMGTGLFVRARFILDPSWSKRVSGIQILLSTSKALETGIVLATLPSGTQLRTRPSIKITCPKQSNTLHIPPDCPTSGRSQPTSPWSHSSNWSRREMQLTPPWFNQRKRR